MSLLALDVERIAHGRKWGGREKKSLKSWQQWTNQEPISTIFLPHHHQSKMSIWVATLSLDSFDTWDLSSYGCGTAKESKRGTERFNENFYFTSDFLTFLRDLSTYFWHQLAGRRWLCFSVNLSQLSFFSPNPFYLTLIPFMKLVEEMGDGYCLIQAFFSI